MSDIFFDDDGRCTTVLTKHKLYKNSRKYFQLDNKRIKNYKTDQIFNNLKKFLCKDLEFNSSEFEQKITSIKNNIKKDKKIENILNGISVPFIIPKLDDEDIGLNIEKTFFPALKNSFKNEFNEFNLINHLKDGIKNQINFWKESRYDLIINKLKKQNLTGILFPALNEFSFPAALETVSKLPDNMILAGGYEIMASIIGMPGLLRKDVGYPPLLWFSSLKNIDDNNICYQIEPYGYNLTLNRRAHLNDAAEYWWHSIVVIEE